jgi:ubiquinone/menaquinone biosynthesis C-methylase UbiE
MLINKNMDKLFKNEQDKYNLIHRYTGLDEKQIGYGRQIEELLVKDNFFHKKWRELVNSNSSFLEVGLGAGEIVKFFHEKNIVYCGIDISDFVVNALSEQGYKTKLSSAHDIKLDDNSFDVVQHLDGMEHIPVEWEYDVLKEELRVSKKYVFHANAMADAYLDKISINNGFNELHVNIKNESGWDNFYTSNKISMGYKILYKDVTNSTYYVILEKQ